MSNVFNKKNIISLVKSYNQQYNDTISIYQTKESLIQSLKEKMKSQCKHPICLERILQPEKIKAGRPANWDKNPVEWLTNIDIDNVLETYEDHFPHYKHIGTYSVDYDTKDVFGKCLADNVCHLNIQSCKNKKYKKISIVFNLSKHYEPGSHWVALIIDVSNNEICYYNSGATPPPKRIYTLMKNIKKTMPQGDKTALRWNTLQHQKSTTECGMFVIHTIIQMIERKFDSVIHDRMLDDTFVFRLRDILFQ